MYLVIRDEKAEHLKEKVHKMKEFACEIMECLEAAKEEGRRHEDDYRHDYSRRDEGYDSRRYDDDDMYGRDMARGRGRGRY